MRLSRESAVQQRKRTMNLQPSRLRAAAGRTPRGSSSLLRLSSAVSRWPTCTAFGQWIDRAARFGRVDAVML
jgi:hypothetical protein